MEKGFAPWFQDQQINWQSTNPNSSPLRFNLPEEPSGRFCGLPRCHRELTSMVNPKEKLPVPTNEVQKKFLVFDQSNDQTTLVYSSIPIPIPIQYHFPKPQINLDFKNRFSGIGKTNEIGCSNPVLDDGNEMNEDSEELRALLYSDDSDSNSDSDSERSTGHSPELPIPGTITGIGRPESESDEEVASSTGARKRHKLETGDYDIVDTASSGKSGINCSGEVAASSGGRVAEVGSEGFPVAGKRSRKESLMETMRVLEDLIPGGRNGKDAMMILDEAINYLRILKVKAIALGLDSY